ncbi:MAG TPA: M48 family metalloprotease [Mycobacteriales bacterium]|nr:M48 family metalloprotease [Mycobacteriales bacterium]
MQVKVGEPCAACGEAVVRPDAAAPWCPACEWNLGAYAGQAPLGWRWVDRLSHRLAFRRDRELFEQSSAQRPGRPGWTFARVVLLAVSALFVLVSVGCVGIGAWLVLHDLASWWPVVGIALIVVGILLRPRLGRRPSRHLRMSRAEAPALYGLLDRVATAAGTKAPDLIAMTPEFNAGVGRVGLRQRPVLVLGVPLWIVLEPRQRVALLAHEIAHQVNGDPMRGLLVRPALTTFARLAGVADAGSIGQVMSPDRPDAGLVQFLLGFSRWLASRVFLAVHLALSALGMRDHQRAEYLADGIATDLAGTDATVALLDCLAVLPAINVQLAYACERKPPAEWRAAAETYQAGQRRNLKLLRHLSMRDTSLWASHPPVGLRARAVEAWPARPAGITFTDAESARIDAELAGWYRATHRLMLGTREFHR